MDGQPQQKNRVGVIFGTNQHRKWIMKSHALHLIKQIVQGQKEINKLEQEGYNINSRMKTLIETNNHLIDELVVRVQIDCNLNDEIKESLLTGG